MAIAITGESTEARTYVRRVSRTIDTHLELIEVLLLSIATILTAWSAFQATKWGGQEAELNSAAAATRAEAVRLSAEADVISDIDTELFLQWLDAFTDESAIDASIERDSTGLYQPDPAHLSGFLYGRFRPDMRVAFDAWMTERPLLSAASTGTPFDRAEYRIAERERAAVLEAEADGQHVGARDADEHGARYVLVAVLIAFVMLFAGMSNKLTSHRSRMMSVGLASALLIVAATVLATMPKLLS